MKVIGHIKQMKVLFFLTIAVLLAFYCEDILAQEARPTEMHPPEAGAVSTITPEESESQLQDAMLLFNRGKTDAAIYMLQQTQKADPTNYKVLFKLGEMAIAARNWAYAINVLRKASFIRPKDIEVRLILMDVYTAYQMPIQEIIVGKEILALDPKHINATTRLAKLYQEQAMPDDEIKIRKDLKRLIPDDYNNLKRLADVYDKSASLWEAAKIYEQIRELYPKNIEDLTRLASIYDQLGEKFRELPVLDQIEGMGKKRDWLKGRAIKTLRNENSLRDPLKPRLNFLNGNGEEMDVFTTTAEAKYLHVRLRSSIDIGVEAKFTHIHHRGRKALDGRMDIESETIIVKAVKNWQGGNYTFEARLGLLRDEVHGSLSPRDPTAGLTATDFPFFKHPSFNTYGGFMPVANLKFQATPGLHATYQIEFEHGLVEDLDARLRMFYFDKTTLSYTYKAGNNTELVLQIDESSISDGNFRFHSLFSINYTLWGSTPMYSHRDRFRLPFWRKSFFGGTPLHYIKVGFKWNYNDASDSKSTNYEVFRGEKRHTYHMEARSRIYNRGQGRNVFLYLQGGFSDGTTLDFRRQAGVKLMHSDDKSEFGLSYNFTEESATNASGNVRISGKSRSSTISAYLNLKF